VKPREYQKTGIKFLADNKRALLGDDMGIGKTLQAVWAARYLKAKTVLIVCPSAVTYSWLKAIKQAGRTNWTTHVVTQEVEEIPEVSVVICSYHLLNSPAIYDQINKRWGVCIVDEVHYLKNNKAQRSAKMLKRGGIAAKCVYFWGLSGTIQPNNPIDMYLLLSTLFKDKLGKYANYITYIRTFCGAYRTAFGWQFGKPKNIDRLKQMIKPFYLRRLKEEVLHELPAKSLSVNWVDDFEMTEEWDEMLSRIDTTKNSLGLTLDEMTEERKLSAQAKLDAVSDYIEGAEEKTVVFCWHREIVDALHERYKGKCVKYYGGMTPKKKEEAKERFSNSSRCKYFFANIASAGTGLDGLQHAASRCIFVEIPWGFTELFQAIDRLHRMGQGQPVQAEVFALRSPIDEYMIKTISRKHQNFIELHA